MNFFKCSSMPCIFSYPVYLCCFSRFIFPSVVAVLLSALMFPPGLGQFMAGEVSNNNNNNNNNNEFIQCTYIYILHTFRI